MQACFLIPAHNEAEVIGDTVRHLAGQGHTALVIADNCSDATARVAAEAGAEVYERHEAGCGGKGAALAWFLATAADRLQDLGMLVVLDADSRVGDGFLPAMDAAFARGAVAAQGFVSPVGAGQSPASALAAYSELLSQRIGDNIRAHLGWTVHLRGTGMAFRPTVLRELVAGLSSRVEDAEMSLRLAQRGVRVHYVPGAVVYDPKPASAARVSRQRARWLQGQVEVWRHHWREIVRLALTGGPEAWSLLWAALVKPKTLVFATKVALMAGVSLLALSPLGPRWLWHGLAALIALSLAVDLAYYMLGLLLVEDRRLYARALLLAPLYLGVWLRSLVLMRISREAWLRARD